jgi:hypothetical protein
LALRASGLWRQSAVLKDGAPLDIDDALSRLEAGTLRGPVMVRGAVPREQRS